MDVLLVMFMDDGERREFPLTQPRTVVGRTNDCDLRVPLSAVSRRQCEFLLENDTVLLRDLGSSNGTFHNGDRVQEATLSAGDEVGIGPIMFTVVIDGQPSDVPAPSRTGSARKSSEDSATLPAMIDDDDELDDLESMDMPTGLAAEAAPDEAKQKVALAADAVPSPEVELLSSNPSIEPVKDDKAKPTEATDTDELDDDDFANLLAMDEEEDDDAFAALEALADEVGPEDDESKG